MSAKFARTANNVPMVAEHTCFAAVADKTNAPEVHRLGSELGCEPKMVSSLHFSALRTTPSGVIYLTCGAKSETPGWRTPASSEHKKLQRNSQKQNCAAYSLKNNAKNKRRTRYLTVSIKPSFDEASCMPGGRTKQFIKNVRAQIKNTPLLYDKFTYDFWAVG